MTRYISNYQKIKNKIETIRTILDDINVQDISNEDNKVEFLRYKKNFSILEDIIENVEPELLNANIKGFTDSSQNSLNNLINFKDNNTHTEYISESNNYLDVMSNFIRPFILHRKRLKNSLAKAIEEYVETIEDHLHNINEFKDELQEAKKYTEDIKLYHSEVLDENNEESIKFKIDTIFQDIESKKSEIYKFYNELLSDDKNISIKTEILEAKDEIDSTKEESKGLKQDIEDIFTNSSKTLKELKEFYVEIFGEINDETEERLGGLEQEIKKRLSDISKLEIRHENLIKEHKEKYVNLEEEINSLLHGATNVGLAKSYSENKDKFEKQTNFWNKFFIGTMVAIFVFGIYLVVEEISIDTQHIFKYSPLYVSVVWLALFASKRGNESMRLEQEYTHKETLARSYMSYKEQIESLEKDGKNELLQKLLESTTATISQNPNHVLDKKNTEQHPAMEFFNSIWTRKKS